MTTRTLSFSAAALIVAAGLGGTRIATATGTDTPPYTVKQQDGAIEIRAYPERVRAVMRARGTRNRAARDAVMPLFRYVSGQARDGGLFSRTMTAPLTQEISKGGTWAVSVAMPRGSSPETLPVPRNKVRLATTPAHRAAVIRFTGRWSNQNFARHTEDLMTWLRERGLKPAGPAAFAYYDTPLTPWFARRNEVIVPLAD